MGNLIFGLFTSKTAPADKVNDDIDDEQIIEANEYDDDVQDAANLALAMQQEDNTTNYELKLACENLPKMDRFSLTDPMIVVFMEVNDKFKELDKTEIIMDTLDPKFSKSFTVSYNPELNQKMRFDVYDIEVAKEKDDLSK